MKNCCLLLLFVCFSLTAQDYTKNWDKVVTLEREGKTKSAGEAVNKIYRKALSDKNEPQLLHCFFYQSKYLLVLEENAQKKILDNLIAERKRASIPTQAILSMIYAKCLQNYVDRGKRGGNFYGSETPDPADFQTWTRTYFDQQIDSAYSNSLLGEKVLLKTPIKKYDAIFDYGTQKTHDNESLLEFLLNEHIEYLKTKIDRYNRPVTVWKLTNALSPNTKTFVGDQFKGLRAGKAFIELLHNYKKLETIAPTPRNIFNRIAFFSEYIEDGEKYLAVLSALQKNTTDPLLKQDIQYERAFVYTQRAARDKFPDYNKRAMLLLDSIISSNQRNTAVLNAKTLKYRLLYKQIDIQFEDNVYAGQNARAFVEYKNTSSLRLKYYAIYSTDFALDQWGRSFLTDSVIAGIRKKRQPKYSNSYVLIDPADYCSHSTEILLPKIATAAYLVCYESEATGDQLLGHSVITATSMTVATRWKKDTLTHIVLDRQSGKPLQGVKIKTPCADLITDGQGIAKVIATTERYYDHPTVYQLPGDTLTAAVSYFQSEDRYDTKSSVRFYLDRHIYRPGQKVYFKGIASENDYSSHKKIVPNVPFKVSIYDPNRQEIMVKEMTTNDYGSFAGEFTLPKTVLTGEFRIEAEEPDDLKKDPLYDRVKDEHPFWDHTDFRDEDVEFNVEEYKRPAFEITFDEQSKDLKLDKKVTVSGKAKAFSGSTLSNAAVKYKITSYGFSNNDLELSGETQTDESGKFNIEFVAQSDSTKVDYGSAKRSFNIEATVTDINGETHAASTNVMAGHHSLVLFGSIRNRLETKNNNKLILNTTNLNGKFKAVKGEMRLYQMSESKGNFKARLWPKPEFAMVDDVAFSKLFPHEANENAAVQNETGKLVKEIAFDTEKEKSIAFDFIKEYKQGSYRIILSAKDSIYAINDTIPVQIIQSKLKYDPDQLFTLKTFAPKGKQKFARLNITSAIPNLNVVVDCSYLQNSFFQKTVALVDGKAELKIPISQSIQQGFGINATSIFENADYTETAQLKLNGQSPALRFEIQSFRSKIEPGGNENWSFKLIAENTKADSEILASMYDASLDKIASPDNWPDLISYDTSFYSDRIHGFGRDRVSLNGMNAKYYSYIPPDERLQLIWFGFNFSGKQDYYSERRYRRQITDKSAKPSDAKLVSGYVHNSSGPLYGVNITIKGTNRSVVSDADGYYEIEAGKGEVLVFEDPGYEYRSVDVDDNDKVYDVDMKSNMELGSVEVRGYSTTTKSKQTNAITTVTTEGNADMLEALSGSVAGLQISSGEGAAGAKYYTLSLRNDRSSGKSGQMLVIVDGVPIDAQEMLKMEPGLVEDVTVLKDAAATEIYGSRGANGVLIITTKAAVEKLQQVETRKNLSETAFFYPSLKLDKDGILKLNFTAPEALTQWKLRMFAHNKDAVTAYIEKLSMTQKDIMITPNFPRFFRENDTIVIQAKIANMTTEAKMGMAMLQLYDAVSMQSIDMAALNAFNVRNFNISANGNSVVSWKIKVPEGLQGLQYKIVAKSGDFSDGEENIIPVLTNSMLVTESIPLWVREKSKRSYTFDNLKNNTSTSLRNHQFILEYTSNPVWIAMRALPYLIEYEHECAEQTFARFYANSLAGQILNKNPKIKNVLDDWKKSGVPASKLQQNPELKSLLLAETPWINDAQSEEQQKKNFALLLDLDKLRESSSAVYLQLKNKQLPSGGFPWFDGGKASDYITEHIAIGLGHLKRVNDSLDFSDITKKAVSFLDDKYLQRREALAAHATDREMIFTDGTELHYLYMRSFYTASYALPEKIKAGIEVDLASLEKQPFGLPLYEKAMAALVLSRFGHIATAKKIVENLRQTSANNEDWGMYWIENTAGWRWNEAPIETQALLIEVFSEIENDKKAVDAMKVWLLKNKQNQNWPSTKSTTEAVYALLMQGSDWTSVKENTKISVGDQKMTTTKLSENQKEADSGYLKMTWKDTEITPDMATVTIENKSTVPGYGGLFWQYFEDLDKIKPAGKNIMSVEKHLYAKRDSADSPLKEITSESSLRVGDLISVQLIIKTSEDVEYVHLKDMRASCFEPVDVLSGYNWIGGTGFYRSTKDAATHFFFDRISKGTLVVGYDMRVNNQGDFSNGITTIESMYAPEFSSHTKGIRVSVETATK